jgi:ABC-2 type transport system ATP-binding protein
MIVVEGLSRRFGAVRAVDRVDFIADAGQVVGLLGPNGAGKTTTLRMLSTFLRPSSGTARVAGFDIRTHPDEVRARLGYLPENVPLYLDMRVGEALVYRARLMDVPRSRRRATTSRVVAECGLGEVEHRLIGHLSRGYRQRVGLAEALVGDPEVVVLDEPTAGLDPIQIREVRALVRSLGASRTVMLSTHILPEVESVCDRVVLLAGGRVVLDETLEDLRAEVAVVVEALAPPSSLRRLIEATPGVRDARLIDEKEDATTFEVRARDGADPRADLARRIVRDGWELRRLDWRRSSLEERFVAAVARAADAGPPPMEAA